MKAAWGVCLALGVFLGCRPSEPPQPLETVSPGERAVEQTPAPETIRVAFVTNNPSDFWVIARAGTEKAVEELGCKVDFRMPQSGTAEEQHRIVEDLLARGVSGIAISPKDPENQIELLNKAAAKVNLVTQDSDAPASDRLCYIGTNNYEAGRVAGDLIKQVLPEGGKIMLFVGTLDAQNAQDRKKGIEDVIEGAPITIVDTRTDETDRMKAILNVQDALTTYPDLACLVGLWSYNGPAILNAVRDSGKLNKIAIVCFDEEHETLQGVKDGHIAGTVVQQPYLFGYQSVHLLVQLAQGDRSMIPQTKQIFIPVKVVTRENVDEFWAELKKLTGKPA